jgi:hypothetical protein
MNSKDYFDQVAHDWDKMRESFFSASVREKSFFIAGLKPGKIAAGSGFMSGGLLQSQSFDDHHVCLRNALP